ncbi:MAG: ABC transporter permease subunit [Anaerolineae bacterium]
MRWRRMRAIIRKEWQEIRKNKMILSTMIFLPVVLVGMILVTDYFMLRYPDEGDAPPMPPALEAMGPEGFVVVMNEQYMFYLLLIPAALPVAIAAYSIIGEKETRSLEPLLATPVSTWELLAAKTLAATTPAVLITWVSYAALLLGSCLLVPPQIFAYLARPVWVVSMLLLSPLFALLSVLSGVIASSRINDPRAAQSVAAIFIVPVMGLSIGVLMGRILVSLWMVLAAAAVLLAVNIGVLAVAVRLFQRETILTRWK